MLTLDAGIAVNGTFTFHKNNLTPSLEIQKTQEVKITLLFAGLDRDNRLDWRIKLNDRLITAHGQEFSYCGSKKFVFSIDEGVLKIEETDETETGTHWIDLDTNESSNTKITNAVLPAIASAKNFKPEDPTIIPRKILHNSQVVIIYARNEDWKTQKIYVADRVHQTFVECLAEMGAQCKCPCGDSYWKIKFPGEDQVHQLSFSRGNGSHEPPKWDDKLLKEVGSPLPSPATRLLRQPTIDF